MGRRCLAVLTLTLALEVTSSALAAPKPGTSDPVAPAIPQRYLDQEIAWQTCSFDSSVKNLHPGAPTTECAKVKAPMDWHAPDAHPDIEIAIAYSRATGTSRGLMASNPGAAT